MVMHMADMSGIAPDLTLYSVSYPPGSHHRFQFVFSPTFGETDGKNTHIIVSAKFLGKRQSDNGI